jgi:hypothetical protein
MVEGKLKGNIEERAHMQEIRYPKFCSTSHLKHTPSVDFSGRLSPPKIVGEFKIILST